MCQLLIINRLHQVLRPFLLRRLKSEVADQLPEKVECVLKCELSAWQLIMYNNIKRCRRPHLLSALFAATLVSFRCSTADCAASSLRRSVCACRSKALATVDKRTGELRPAKLSNTLMQLRKVCNHPRLFVDYYGRDWQLEAMGLEIVRSSGKFALLHRMLPKLLRAGHRILLFCQMTRVMDIVEEYFEWQQYKWLRLDGTHAVGDRNAALDAFNAPNSDFPIFLLSTRAGGLGLNLQTADTVIIFDSDWNPQMDIQAQDRAHRVGQKKEVRVFRLISMSPVEEGILERARFKLGIDQMVIQSGKFNAQSSADERKDLLQAVLREGVKYGSEVRAPSDAEINAMMARTPEEIDLFSAIDAEIEEKDRQAWKDEGRGDDGPPTRLMSEDEVPGFIKNQEEIMEQQKGPEQELGRGGKGRQTKAAVSYAEELTDKEFERALERGEDPYEAVLRKQEKRILIEQGILPEDGRRKRKKKRPVNGEKRPRLDKKPGEPDDPLQLEDAEGLLEDSASSDGSSSASGSDDEGHKSATDDAGERKGEDDEGRDEGEGVSARKRGRRGAAARSAVRGGSGRPRGRPRGRGRGRPPALASSGRGDDEEEKDEVKESKDGGDGAHSVEEERKDGTDDADVVELDKTVRTPKRKRRPSPSASPASVPSPAQSPHKRPWPPLRASPVSASSSASSASSSSRPSPVAQRLSSASRGSVGAALSAPARPSRQRNGGDIGHSTKKPGEAGRRARKDVEKTEEKAKPVEKLESPSSNGADAAMVIVSDEEDLLPLSAVLGKSKPAVELPKPGAFPPTRRNPRRPR